MMELLGVDLALFSAACEQHILEANGILFFFWARILEGGFRKSHVPAPRKIVHPQEAIGLGQPKALWGVHYFARRPVAISVSFFFP